METQHHKILALLDNGQWHCTSEMYALYMADPRKRLCELKKKGYNLEKDKCHLHNYHKGQSKMWRLVPNPLVFS